MAKGLQPAVAYLRTSSAANVGADKDSDKRQRAAIDAFAKHARNADWKDALSKRWDAVILAGGDGTMGVAERLHRLRVANKKKHPTG